MEDHKNSPKTDEAQNRISTELQPAMQHKDATSFESEWFASEIKTILLAGFFLFYALLWIIWIFFNKDLWSTAIKMSVTLSRIRGFLLIYCWTFSEIFFKWYIFIFGILIVYAPRKDRAWTSIATFIASYTFRQYFRLIAEESRPQYDSLDIVGKSCNCSFGMPSGHSEGSTMLYTLLFYNFMSSRPSTKQRVILSSFAAWICLSIYFSRIYFGRHSLLQVSLGGSQGLLFFLLMLRFEKPLNAFFLDFLNGGKNSSRILLAITSISSVLSLVLWYSYFDGRLKSQSYPHVRCDKCFAEGNLGFRLDLGKALQLPFLAFTLVLGQYLANPRYSVSEGKVEKHLSHQFRILGLKRGLTMILCYSPLAAFFILNKIPSAAVPLACVVDFISGYLLGSLPLIFDKLRWSVEGDVGVEGSQLIEDDLKLAKDVEML